MGFQRGVVEGGAVEAYGAMITRAPGCGMGPMPSMDWGTWPSQPSSCLESVGPWSEYHEPAWLASLFTIEVQVSVFEQVSRLGFEYWRRVFLEELVG